MHSRVNISNIEEKDRSITSLSYLINCFLCRITSLTYLSIAYLSIYYLQLLTDFSNNFTCRSKSSLIGLLEVIVVVQFLGPTN